MSLSENDLQRYSRQIQLPGIGLDGQERLKQARVLLVGVGGLGSPASLYLAAAGIGTLGLIDDDTVSLSNLQRQILFEDEANGKKKVLEAERRLSALNPSIEIFTYDQTLTQKNAREIFEKYDLVLDGTDNFKTRYLISQACLATGKPHVYAGIFQFEGQVAIFTNETACYRCLFPKIPDANEIPNCSEAGVLGALPGIIGSLQALETLKYLLNLSSRPGQLFVFDALHLDSRMAFVGKRPDCENCGPNAKTFDANAEDPIETLQLTKQLGDIAQAPLDAIILDVRTPEEFLQKHHPSARNIPVSNLADELASLSKNKTYVVYCASGQRSYRAQALLMRQGFGDVWNLRGGLVL